MVEDPGELIRIARVIDRRQPKTNVARISAITVSAVVDESRYSFDQAAGDYYLMLAIVAQERAGLHSKNIQNYMTSNANKENNA